MAPSVRTHAEVLRWIAVQTGFALSLVVPATLLAVYGLLGGDFSQSVSGQAALAFSLFFAVAETLVFAPIVAVRSVGALRLLNLAYDELTRIANTDSLTGLLNRRGFEAFSARLGATPRALGRPLAIVIFDIDFFKRVNDDHGHEFGDAALRHVAGVLRAGTGRRNAALARHGGEEFVALLPGCMRHEALEFAEGLRIALAHRPFEWNGAAANITMSVGFAATPVFDGRIAGLMSSADAALYEAKRGGRNRVAVAKEGLRAAA